MSNSTSGFLQKNRSPNGLFALSTMKSFYVNPLKRRLVLLGVILFVIIVNLVFTHTNSTRSYSFDNYYIVRRRNVKDVSSAGVIQVDDDGFVSHLTDQIKQELLLNDAFLAMVKQNVTDRYAEEFKSDLQKEIDSQYTRELFGLRQKDLGLFEDLKVKFARDHKQEIIDYVVHDVLTDLLRDDTTKLAETFSSKLSPSETRGKYYRDIIENILLANGPKSKGFASYDHGIDVPGNQFREVTQLVFSREYLTNHRTKFKEGVFDDLQQSHDAVVKALRNLSPPPKSVVNGDGIVINGGGAYLSGALIVIGQIRETGSKLPIELILNSDLEYDTQICDQLLPSLGGKCLVIERELGKEFVQSLKLEKFQLKVMGLLISSFDNIIALDADSLPIKNVDSLLASDVYLTNKFLLWPDLWHKGTAPKYYEIARFPIGEPVRRNGISNDASFAEYIVRNKDTEIMFHDLDGVPPAMGVESGELVFSKHDHFRSFLLSLYYNIFGKTYYYPMLYQGTFGLGDRETFIPALHVFNEPYYLVRYDLWFAGYGGEKLEETTIVQHDPQQAVEFFVDWGRWLSEKGMDTRLAPFQDNDYTRKLFEEFKTTMSTPEKPYKLPDVYFLHVHRPKIDPLANTSPDEDIHKDIFSRRNLGEPGKYASQFGKTDWELKFHSISQWLVCDGITSDDFWKQAKVSKQSTCRAVSKYVDFLKSDSQDLQASELHFIKKD